MQLRRSDIMKHNIINHTIYDTITVDIDFSKYNKKIDECQKVFIDTVKDGMDEYVPASEKKSLANSAHIENENTEVVYNKVYARYQYGGKVVTTLDGRTWAHKGERKPVVTNRDLKYKKDIHPKATDHWYDSAKKDKLDDWLKEIKGVMKNNK